MENISQELKKDKYEELIQKINKIFDILPLDYKWFIMEDEIIMCLYGLKASIGIYFEGDTYNKDKFNIFKNAFIGTELKLSEIKDRQTGNSEGGNLSNFKEAKIYNPKILKEQSDNSEFCPKYDGKMDIYEYEKYAENAGYNKYAVNGKLFSYPESAISYFVERQINPELKLKPHSESHAYGESYMYAGGVETPKDIVERESAKRAFFTFLKLKRSFQNLQDSDILKQSKDLWLTLRNKNKDLK